MDEKREHKTFWVWHEYSLFKAKGYKCETQQKRYDKELWFFPSIG